MSFILSIKYFIVSKYEMLKRMAFWAWNMRYSYDFDAHTVNRMIYLKLNRVYTCMRDDSHLLWNSSESNTRMRQLKETVELFKRASEDDYSMRAFDETEEKFGKLKTWTEPVEGKPGLSWYKSKWPNDKQARVFYEKRIKHWANVEKQNSERMWHLLSSNINNWWD